MMMMTMKKPLPLHGFRVRGAIGSAQLLKASRPLTQQVFCRWMSSPPLSSSSTKHSTSTSPSTSSSSSTSSTEPAGVSWARTDLWRRAGRNTLQCLLGCSIGDFGAVAVCSSLDVLQPPGLPLMAVAMTSGIATSLALETVVLRRQGFAWRPALSTAFNMSMMSMLAMETAENATDYILTGGTMAMTSTQLWAIPASLLAGFLVPLPYNYWRLARYNRSCH